MLCDFFATILFLGFCLWLVRRRILPDILNINLSKYVNAPDFNDTVVGLFEQNGFFQRIVFNYKTITSGSGNKFSNLGQAFYKFLVNVMLITQAAHQTSADA